MNPAVKYTLGRLGLFVVVLLALLPVPMNLLVKVMVALFSSAAISFVLLRGWRDEMAEQLHSAAQRRRAEKANLRAALAGDEGSTDSGRTSPDGPTGSSPTGPTAGGPSPSSPSPTS